MDQPGAFSATRRAHSIRGGRASARSDAGEGGRLAREPFRCAEIWQRRRARLDAGERKGGAGMGAARRKWRIFASEELFDPKTNLEAGTWYLRRAIEHWQNQADPIPFALAEYNAGASRAQRWAGGDDTKADSRENLSREHRFPRDAQVRRFDHRALRILQAARDGCKRRKARNNKLQHQRNSKQRSSTRGRSMFRASSLVLSILSRHATSATGSTAGRSSG